jgi:di-N-acetylchitobiase
MWDKDFESPWFQFIDSADGMLREVWYDDPESLTLKYQMAKKLNLRGVSMWNSDCLDYGNTYTAKELVKQMWDAIENGFF